MLGAAVLKRMGVALPLLWAAACMPASGPTVTPTPHVSLWGDIIAVGVTEQSSAPAMWVDNQQVVLAWIGSDDAGVHQDMRMLLTHNPLPIVVQPLPPIHPFAQSVYAAVGGGTQLLWLDSPPDQRDQLRLYAALVLSDLTLDRGPTLVSDDRTLRYTAAPAGEGALWVVWSGGLIAEPSLHVQFLDLAGRPRPSQHLTDDADWPVLAHTNDGTLYLYWMDSTLDSVYGARLDNGTLENTRKLLDAPGLGPGDRLEIFSAALDQTTAYLFWNITRADGISETWLAAGSPDADTWTDAFQLGIDTGQSATIQTGFNSGIVQASRRGETRITWASPLGEQSDVLPVAVRVANSLGIIYFQAGQVIGYQIIVSGVRLIGVPALAADQNRHLYLAWSEPGTLGTANLDLTMTRP